MSTLYSLTLMKIYFQVKSGHGNTTRHQTVQGLSFPITNDAQDAIHQFKEGSVNHLELVIYSFKDFIVQTTWVTYVFIIYSAMENNFFVLLYKKKLSHIFSIIFIRPYASMLF